MRTAMRGGKNVSSLGAMATQKVPLAFAIAYTRETRLGHMFLSHVGLEMLPIRACVGLLQRCSASPRIFRWALQDCLQPLHENWSAFNMVVAGDDTMLAHEAWADDTWFCGDTPEISNMMLAELEQATSAQTGLLIRWG